MWGRQSYRWNREDFLANEKEGIATPWPIGYDDMAPWYEHVERHAGLSGLEDMDVLPDSVYLHAMELNCVEKTAAERIRKSFDEKRRLIIGRTANIAVPHKGRTDASTATNVGWAVLMAAISVPNLLPFRRPWLPGI